MSKFGFDAPLNLEDFSGLPEKKTTVKPKNIPSGTFAEEAEKLGFSDRSPATKKSPQPKNRKPGRKPPPEPKAKVLISGPESIMNEFKQYCENNGNIPYWEGLERLMKR